MNEDELKATIGEAAFTAMSAEQKTALLGKFAKPTPPPAPAPTPKPEDDPDLKKRAELAREAEEKDKARTKQMETAMRFSLQSKDFLKTNESLLPKGVTDIFAQAEKENYDNAIQKDAAIKAGLIASFFEVQANVDLLTPGLKSQLDEYLKLTKNGRQDKAQAVYDSVFEPAFEMLKRMKKADALSKGYGGGSDAETEYKNRLIKASRQHYLGEK